MTTTQRSSISYRIVPKLQRKARDYFVSIMARRNIGKPIPRAIHFPLYHGVFDDEKTDFARQVAWMKKNGEFVSIDDALELLQSSSPINGCYFCITIDDGFKNCYTNALPIIAELDAKAVFYIPTDFIGTSSEGRGRGWNEYITTTTYGCNTEVEFLSWEELRLISKAGMTIGSHSANHRPLSALSESAVMEQVRDSKALIEQKLGVRCLDFACPLGKAYKHYDPEKHPSMIAAAGYRSFATTVRGRNDKPEDAYSLKRDFLLPEWPDAQLRYYFSR